MDSVFSLLLLVFALSGCLPETSVERETFAIGENRTLDLEALETFVEQPHAFARKPNIYFFFVDTLRRDKMNKEDTPSIVDLRSDSLRFDRPFSASTVTHSSTYSILYSNPVIHRDQLLLQGWKKGSPFLQALKRGGYKISLNASPWQFCIDTHRIFSEPKELKDSAESNLQLSYGMKTKELVDFCYPNPGGESIPQREPKVPFTGVDEDGKTIGHQGYRDHEVVSDLLRMIDNRAPGEEGNFHLIYLSGVHDPYGWLEHGHPIPGSDKFEPIENYYKINKPYFPWNANWNAYRPDAPTADFKLRIKNAYINAVRGADYQVSRVVEKLKEKNEFENSIVIFLSDHGEFVFETDLFPGDNNNRIGHCCSTYSETTDVPIFIRFPNAEFKAERKIGSHLDVMPTLLHYLGYSNQDQIANIAVGKSLFESNRTCSMSFDPRGKFAPSRFFITNVVDPTKLYMELLWKSPTKLGVVRSRFLLTPQDKLLVDFREKLSDPKMGQKLLRRGENAQCLEEILVDPFPKEHYCPTISPVKIPDLTRSFQLFNGLDILASSTFKQVTPSEKIASVERSGANVLEDYDEVPLIPSNFDAIIGSDFHFDTAFFQNELKKVDYYKTLEEKDYFEKFKKLKRVNGFAFLGTGAPPDHFQQENGVCALRGNFDLIQYYHEGKPSQFVSTSRSPLMAKRFASVNFSDKSPRDGWVYVVLVMGGIEDPKVEEKLRHKNIKEIPILEKRKNIDDNYDLPIVMSLYAEQEIAVPKGINWSQVVAYRAVKRDGMFSGPIFVRSALQDLDKNAYESIIRKLSGE